MKIEDILALTKAGWSKDEILSLGNPSPEQQEDPAPADPAPEQTDPAPAPVDDERLKKIETQLEYAINRLNYIAVSGSQQPEDQHTETVDDILSNIIN